MIVEKLKKLEEVEKKYDLLDISDSLKQEYAIRPSKEIEKVLEENRKEGRKLKLGVIGRVKAGKSSLINSLIFNGDTILPKAATPMTAALTVLEYSDEFKAEIEFYSKEDIKTLKEKHKEYEDRFNKLYKKYLEELKNEERAKKRVYRELKDTQLFAYYDQYEKIKNSNINVDELETDIKASSLEELNEKLKDYVGSSGKYMPFTKAVRLKVNKKELEEIEIIDTPGVNDPVISREERTRELLKYCDVIFIVSPSGQFLNEDDLSLIDRISSKDGIKEIYLIASQVDTQLYGSERRDNLYESLELISNKLTNYARDVFEKDDFLKESIVYKFIQKNKVLTTSAIAYAIAKKLGHKLDANEEHTFKLLQKFYEDYFQTNARDNLLKLSGINTLKELLEDVRKRKENILEEKNKKFEETQLKSIIKYQEVLKKEIQNKITKLKNTNIEEMKEKSNNLLKIKKEASNVVNEEFKDLVEEFEIEAKNYLFKELDKFFRSARDDVKSSEDIESKTYTTTEKVEKKGLLGTIGRFFGGILGQDDWGYEEIQETHTETYTVVRAGIVRNSLEELTYNIESSIDVSLREFILKFRKNLFKHLVGVLREKVGDENLDVYIISSVLRKVVNSVEIPEISYADTFPSYLKQNGTLTRGEAEVFLNEAYNYISSLKGKVQNDIKSYLSNLHKELLSFNIADSIFKSYDEEIEKLKKEIENKELSIKRYEKILKELSF